MALELINLDPSTRSFMLDELTHDVREGRLYLSPRLSPSAAQDYESLLRQALESYDDRWLAARLRAGGYFQATEPRRKPTGGVTMARVPVNAPEVLAEGEFNRFYIRGLCRRAMEEGQSPGLVVYRAKAVENPRPDSEAKVGSRVDPARLLQDLRTNIGVDTALGLPNGPNSGLSVRLP